MINGEILMKPQLLTIFDLYYQALKGFGIKVKVLNKYGLLRYQVHGQKKYIFQNRTMLNSHISVY